MSSNVVRNAATLAIAAFLVVGVCGWVGGMPKPSSSVPYAFVEVAPEAGVSQARAAAATSAATPLVPGSAGSATDGVISADWLLVTGSATAIPVRALQAYSVAAVTLATRAPGCKLGWTTLAAIGQIESQHGTHDGASIDGGGQLVGSILGPRLDGVDFQKIVDTDDGRWDGDAEYDRAVGPMQFVPATWLQYGEDGSGDGVADPNQIDDAALTAGVYLCSVGQDLSTDEGWTAAVRAYNQDDAYVESVRKQANDYLQLAG